MEIPTLKFPRDEIIEIIPAVYQNEAKRIHIPGLDNRMAARGSPEDIRIPSISLGGESGALSPIPGMSSPAELVTATSAVKLSDDEPLQRPPEKVVNKAKEMVADKVADED